MKLWVYDSHLLCHFSRLSELCESTHQVAAQLLVQFTCVYVGVGVRVRVCVCARVRVCACVRAIYKVFNSSIT
jgi:hypothetical protein